MARTTWAILTAVVCGALLACGGGTDAATSTSIDQTGDEQVAAATTGTVVGPEDGISLEEAEELGVLTGDHDALLTGPIDVRSEEGCAVAVVSLQNVGQRPDTYDLAVLPDVADVTPARVDLAPGHEAEITVRACEEPDALVLQAHSAALGRVVAELRFG